MIVADSSPIIILAKQGMFELFKKCFKKLIIPTAVHYEVMQKKGSPEAVALENAIRQKWVSVKKTDVMAELHTKNIGQGEKEAISLARKLKTMLIMDDDAAKKYASIFGIEAHGTFYVVFLACEKKAIDKSDAMHALEAMRVDGFYVSAELYSAFFELLNTME